VGLYWMWEAVYPGSESQDSVVQLFTHHLYVHAYISVNANITHVCTCVHVYILYAHDWVEGPCMYMLMLASFDFIALFVQMSSVGGSHMTHRCVD
jgi:hypothetical protein